MSSRNRWRALAIVSSALFLITIDMTVLYIALPTLTHELEATASEKLWILNAYALMVAGLLPGMGTLGDRVGHRRMFLSGLCVFGLASLLAAFAPSSLKLIAARVALGAGAAMMMPATLSIIRLLFADVRERAFAMGVWGAISAGGAALGPVLGGVLLEYFWWGSVFLINVPVVAAAFVAGWLVLPKDMPEGQTPWSPLGSFQVMIGLMGVTFAIKECAKTQPSWSMALAALAIGVTGLAVFVRGQRRSASPLIDFRLFADRDFSTGVAVALFSSLAMIGVELALSQRMQLVLGLTPLYAALAILPIPLAAFVGGPLSGLALPRLGARKLLFSMLLLTCAGLVLLLLGREGHGVLSMSGMAAIGLGMGAGMSGASTVIMGRASARQAGMAASIEEVSFEMGGALGIAVFGAVLSAVYSATLMLPGELAGLSTAYDSLDAAILASESLAPEAAGTLVALARASFEKAFTAVVAIASAMLLAVAFAVVFRRRAG